MELCVKWSGAARLVPPRTPLCHHASGTVLYGRSHTRAKGGEVRTPPTTEEVPVTSELEGGGTGALQARSMW